MAVTVSGMFGNGKTYFAGSPVVIDINGLEWGNPVVSPFTIVRVVVIYNGRSVGEFKADTGGQTGFSFDISSALRAIWSDFGFDNEVSAAENARSAASGSFRPSDDGTNYANGVRTFREYSLDIYTEYLDSTDGEFTETYSGNITGGRCGIGGLTEWERSNIGDKANADMSYWQHTNKRNGDASTKPTSSPERVGSDSITSWVDVENSGTQVVFYPSSTGNGRSDDAANAYTAHAPIVLRDSRPYQDFLFVNRRGAIETCSALMLEAMGIDVEATQYAHIGRPSFMPSSSLISIGYGGRRSWLMSSGYVTREWAEWWTMEFLAPRKNRRHWMLYEGRYVPVIVTPAKKDVTIYDHSKQQMPHVDFTVTLALEG